MAKSSRAQRESEGVVVLRMAVTKNAVGGKDPCFGRVRNEGKCQGMADTIGPNHPGGPMPADNARQPPHALGARAERFGRPAGRADVPPRFDTRGAVRWTGRRVVHASFRRPSVSRVREIRTHGLKGGPALSPMILITV